MTIAKSQPAPSDVSEARYHLGIAIRFLIHAAATNPQYKLAIEMLYLIRDKVTPHWEPCNCAPGKCAGMHNFEPGD